MGEDESEIFSTDTMQRGQVGASSLRAPLPVNQTLQLFECQEDENGCRLETCPCG